MLAAERIAHAVEVAARRESEHRARAAAETANRAKDEFLALLSHELETRCRRSETPSRRAPRPSIRERALEIAGRRRAARRGSSTTSWTWRGSPRERSAARERVSPRERGERARRERATVRRRARAHDVALSSREAAVDADPARLEQIVENLVTNAAKYTPPGGRIDVALRALGDKAVLRVRDNGMGITAEMLPRVFDLFAQGDARLDRGREDSGIGLTVVRRLVELHGGGSRRASEGPAGSGVHRPPARVADARRRRSQSDDRSAGRPRRASALVEDNPDAAERYRCLLELLGHRVRVVHDGPAAHRARARRGPEMVLVDIGLPGMDGYEVARHLREQPGLEGVTLVALSGYGREEDKQQALAAGFHLHLTKPVDSDRLQALLADLPPRPAGDSG